MTERALAASGGRRRLRTGLITGAALAATALAAVISLTAGPASPPPAAGAVTVTTPLAPANASPDAASNASPDAASNASPDAASTASPDAASTAPAFQGSPPLHITYPGVGMDQDVLPLTPPEQGPASIVPPMTVDAYWLTPYGSPGSTDTTYIIGHSWEGRDSAFNHLSSRAKPGDRIIITTSAGTATYTVTTVSTENKNTLKNSPIWNKVPDRLILVSCYTADLWGTNIIITADQTPRP
ncbi:class F sortase [Arthrobacter humicola]